MSPPVPRARRPKPHINFIEPPLPGLGRQRGDQALGKSREPFLRIVAVVRIIDDQQIEIRSRPSFRAAKLAQAHDRPGPGGGPNRRMVSCSASRLISSMHVSAKFGPGRAASRAFDLAVQELMPDQKGALALPAADQFHAGFEICIGIDRRRFLAIRNKEQRFQQALAVSPGCRQSAARSPEW